MGGRKKSEQDLALTVYVSRNSGGNGGVGQAENSVLTENCNGSGWAVEGGGGRLLKGMLKAMKVP